MHSKGIIGGIGLIAGILAFVGVISPWIEISGWGYSVSISAWDSITESEIDLAGWDILALIGASILLVAALAIFITSNIRPPDIMVGGSMAIIGSIWAYSDIENVCVYGLCNSHGYGIHLTLAGGILGVIGGILGFVGTSELRR